MSFYVVGNVQLSKLPLCVTSEKLPQCALVKNLHNYLGRIKAL